MKKILIVWLIISVIGFFLSFFLLEELRSHDPYQWLNPDVETVESRNLWNERKMLYVYFSVGFFISLITSIGVLIFHKINQRRAKLN